MREDQILNAKVQIWQEKIFYGKMTFLSKALLFCLWLSPAIAYKLPLLNKALSTEDDNTDKPYNSPVGINYKWEWQPQDRRDEGTLMLARLRRDTDIVPKKGEVIPDGKVPPKVKPTEPPLDEFSDSTPYILEASSAAVPKAKSMPILSQNEMTTLTDPEQTTKGVGQKVDEDETTPLTDLEETTDGVGKKLEEDETTPLTHLVQTTKGAGEELVKEETTHLDKSVTTLVTEINPTISEKSINKNKKATTNSQDSSDQSTSPNDKLFEDTTPSISPKVPETSQTPVIAHTTTGQKVTTGWFLASSASSSKPAAVTQETSPTEEKIHAHSIMRQCMLTILILAVVCTIFIISTIALAAKLSSMKQKNKLRHPATYTEMRCISSLLPDSDQQNKPQNKRLKTFAASLEESDGDNTTLNSFLPDH